MPWYDVFWTQQVERHLKEHGVTPEEAAYVVRHPVGVANSRSTGLPIAFGRTETGRSLAVVYELDPDELTVYLVTAYEV